MSAIRRAARECHLSIETLRELYRVNAADLVGEVADQLVLLRKLKSRDEAAVRVRNVLAELDESRPSAPKRR